MNAPIRLQQKFGVFEDRWSPRIVAAANGQLVKLAKFEGEFVWHSHDDEDEIFLVFEGEVVIRLREDGAERQVRLGPGDLFVVPKGVEHKPESDAEAHVVIIEPAATRHTGETKADITVAVGDQNWI